jgi:hypothetical protein
MKRCVTLLAPFALLACGTAAENTSIPAPPAEPEPSVAVGEPMRLVGGQPALVGITRDEFVIHRTPSGLSAVSVEPGSQPMLITDRSGNTFIGGKVVFAWADVDWTTNVGDMTVWTAAHGSQHVGSTLFVEGTVGASENGEHVVYATNVTPTTIDLVIARSDLSATTTILAAVGRASETTCGARYGFVGDRLFVGSCAEGSTNATLQRYELDAAGNWQATEIASNARPIWSASSDGERVAVIDNRSHVGWWEAGQLHDIDDGIASAMMLPDSSAVLYTVGDQLRRAGLPNAEPTPIVTVGYRIPAEWSPDFSQVLYSTQVTYEGGTRRDLRLTNTAVYNPQPTALVAEPVASISRSAFTKDSAYTLYLTDVTPERRSTLNVQPVDGGNARTYANVDDVVAVFDSVILFSSDRTDPNKYPVKATLNVVDVTNGTPTVVEDTIMDGRAFAVNAAGDKVVYVRLDEDSEQQGLYVQPLRSRGE